MLIVIFAIIAVSYYIIRHHYHYLKIRDTIPRQQRYIFLGFKRAFYFWIITMLSISLALLKFQPKLIVITVTSYILLLNAVPYLLIKINEVRSNISKT